MKTWFLVVVFGPVHTFLHTGHANFDFNQCFIFTECFFNFEKGLSGQNHSLSDSQYPLMPFGKPWTKDQVF